MISFFINYLSPHNELVFDKKLCQCYLLILKNGTRSLVNLVQSDPNRFLYFYGGDSSEFLQQHNINELTVFLRDPIKRFFSGLMQQKQNYNFDVQSVIDVWEGRVNYYHPDANITMFDSHNAPQFLFLLRATKPKGLKFNFVSLSRLSELYPNSRKVNIGEKFDFSGLSTSLMNKIEYYLTEDIVLYNQFLNKVTGIEPIIEQIKLETQFFEEYRSYYKVLTYL